jgi:membrane-bound metal-dependent hydrolase YbcI (DUF457 family)
LIRTTMKLPEHLALSYLLAQFGVQQEYGPGGTALVIAAGLLPDLDGVTILAGWRCHRKYHRVIGHGLPLTLAGPALLAWLGAHLLHLGAPGPLWLWLWLQISLLAHLITDVLFYRWPAALLWPFSSRGFGLGLVGWNDLVPTLILYSAAAACLAGAPPGAAAAGILTLALYLGWRAAVGRPEHVWAAWLAGDWAARAAPFWRWLTGDFIPRPPLPWDQGMPVAAPDLPAVP